MRGNSELGDRVHFLGPDLDLERVTLRSHHGGVERLIGVGFGNREMILDPPRKRRPLLVDQAESGVAVGYRRDDDTKGEEIEHVGDIHSLPLELLVDGVEVLDPAVDRALDSILLQQPLEHAANFREPAISCLGPLLDLALEALSLLGVEIEEAEILHLLLDAADAQPIGDRGEDLEGFAGDGDLPITAQVLEGAHVVQPIDELDEDHPHIVHRGQEQTPEVLGFGRLAARVAALVVGHLGQRHHQPGHLWPELDLQLLGGGFGVLENVMEQTGGYGLLVELHLGQDPGNGQRVGEIGLARTPDLALVPVSTKDVRVAQKILVQIRSVSLHPAEDVFDANLCGRRLRNHHSIVLTGSTQEGAAGEDLEVKRLKVKRLRRRRAVLSFEF